jgi:hypothetical protein
MDQKALLQPYQNDPVAPSVFYLCFTNSCSPNFSGAFKVSFMGAFQAIGSFQAENAKEAPSQEYGF